MSQSEYTEQQKVDPFADEAWVGETVGEKGEGAEDWADEEEVASYNSRYLAKNLPDPASYEAEDFVENIVNRILNARAEAQRIKEGWKPRLTRAQNIEKSCLFYYGPWLESYTRSRLRKDKKSVLVPVGMLGYRKKNDYLEVLDEAAAINWALLIIEESDNTNNVLAAKACIIYQMKMESWYTSQMLGTSLSGNAVMELTLTGLDRDWLIALDDTFDPMYSKQPVKDCKTFFDAKAGLAYMKETGELPGGCRYIPEREEFYVSEPRKPKS